MAKASTLSDPAGVVSHLEAITPELRGCAVLDADRRVLACSGDEEEWAKAAGELLGAINDAAESEPAHVHVATGDGEVFCVAQGGLTAVAVAERFVLSSLMLVDMRAALRELAGGR